MFERTLACARLLRSSNGPTAVADVWMGYAVVSGALSPTPKLGLLTLASLCLYHGGMALNDAVDADRDAIDNRGRPIALGSISRATAFRVAWILCLVGVGLAGAASALIGDSTAFALAAALLAGVFAYNSSAKRSAAGPMLMGLCRVLNGLLGMSVAWDADAATAIAPGVLLCVVGLTWFARNEVVAERRGGLTLATCLAASAFVWFAVATPALFPAVRTINTTLVWSVVALVSLRGMAAAVLQPTPQRVGRGVGLAIQGLVMIDAVLATLYAGPTAGLAILALLPVTMLLARFIPQT